MGRRTQTGRRSQMSMPPDLLIGRCSFWPEARDPEAWLRALVTLSNADAQSGMSWTSPRAVGDIVLRGHLSRRGVPGLFGVELLSSKEHENSHAEVRLLHGVGLLELSAHSDSQPSTLNPQRSWQL